MLPSQSRISAVPPLHFLSWHLITQQARPSPPPSKGKSNQSNQTHSQVEQKQLEHQSPEQHFISDSPPPFSSPRRPSTPDQSQLCTSTIMPTAVFVHHNSKPPPRPSSTGSPLFLLLAMIYTTTTTTPLPSPSVTKKRVYLVSQPTTTAVDKAKQANKLLSSRI